MQVIDSLALGGKERVLVDLANSLAARGISVSVCVTRSDITRKDELRPDIPCISLARRWALDPQGFVRFAEFSRAHRPDVYHVHGRSPLVFLGLAMPACGSRAPILLHDHYGSCDTDSSVPLWFRLWGRARVALYVGVCRELGVWAREAGISPDQITVVRNGFDLSAYGAAGTVDLRSEFALPDVPIGIMVGRVCPQKGVDLLISAIAGSPVLRKQTFLVVGHTGDDRYLRHCTSLLKDNALQTNVLFLGNRRNIAGLLKGADYAILPSRSESGPLALVEYMACGKPFVVSLTGDIANRAREKGLPGFVPPADVPRLRSALEEVAALSPRERETRGMRGVELAHEAFSTDSVIGEWIQAYHRLVRASTT